MCKCVHVCVQSKQCLTAPRDQRPNGPPAFAPAFAPAFGPEPSEPSAAQAHGISAYHQHERHKNRKPLPCTYTTHKDRTGHNPIHMRVPMPRRLTHQSGAAPQRRSVTAPQRHSVTAPQRHSGTAAQRHSGTAAQNGQACSCKTVRHAAAKQSGMQPCRRADATHAADTTHTLAPPPHPGFPPREAGGDVKP